MGVNYTLKKKEREKRPNKQDISISEKVNFKTNN